MVRKEPLVKKPNLKAMLFAELEDALTKVGFNFFEDISWFERQRNDLADYYAFEFYKEVCGYRVQPAIHVRSHILDRIYHKISGIAPKEQIYDTAIAFVVWRVFGREKTYECRLRSEDDVKPAARKLIKIFKKTALPFFESYTSIANIDRLYNSDPETPNYWSYLVDFWTRTAYATDRREAGWKSPLSGYCEAQQGKAEDLRGGLACRPVRQVAEDPEKGRTHVLKGDS